MFRIISLLLLVVFACVGLLAVPASAQVAETGYSIGNAKFKEYYEHRGGARVLGYPISREFELLGSRVQFFQRAVLQMQPGGGVGLLNVLDEGLLPYNRINGSTFPEPDARVVGASPAVSDPAYAMKALEFVRANAPDEWEGMSVNFYTTFAKTVRYEDAFPGGEGDAGLLPLINLEIWGLPTSRPTYDPNNRDFVYLRFQRGIMHYDRGSGLTQGILIGDYLKSVMTGQDLPLDLEEQARGSRLYRQYSNGVASGVARPWELPGTSMFAAFERDGVVVTLPAPTAAPTAAPPAPTAAPGTVPSAPPAEIAVVGTSWFVEQTRGALDRLSTKANEHYLNVRRYVYRIEETTGAPSYDVAARTLRVNEATAFPHAWRAYRDNQMEWYAGLIVHNAVHIEQAALGLPYNTIEAEREARIRQKDVVGKLATGSTGGQMFTYMTDVVDGKEFTFGDWEMPRDPVE